jgi:hypothetical protein
MMSSAENPLEDAFNVNAGSGPPDTSRRSRASLLAIAAFAMFVALAGVTVARQWTITPELALGRLVPQVDEAIGGIGVLMFSAFGLFMLISGVAALSRGADRTVIVVGPDEV